MTLSRREFLRAVATTVAVTAFVPTTRSWAVELNLLAESIAIPNLDGELFLAGEILEEAATDFGRIVSRQPLAVLQPGSVRDVQKMVSFARSHGIKVGGMGMVGNSHSTFGQAQVEAGVVIDLSTLNQIHEINADDALVDAGVRWFDLVQATARLGKTPPTLTDYLKLSIGGTLSEGGIGGQAFRAGLQVDNVLELQVVTGRGHLVTCSPTERPFLFNSVRAGLGQFAIIVRARIRLTDAPSRTRTYTALYNAIDLFTGDQELLVRDGRFDYIEGQAVPNNEGGWLFLLEAVKYFDPANEPDDAILLAGLSFIPGTEATQDRDFFDFANRLQPIVELLVQLGVWQLPHPWFDMFVPGPEAPAFIQGVLDRENVGTTGRGIVLIYPCERSKVKTPFLPLPDTEIFYLFSLLRNAVPPTNPNALIARNRTIYENLRNIGGKRYVIGSVPFDRADWQDHFGTQWPNFVLAKRLFDPQNVLTPGQGIFSF